MRLTSAKAIRIQPGDIVPTRDIETVLGTTIRVPDDARLVHLQFRRYAGCPVCNLHLRAIEQRHDEISQAGVIEVAVFHSRAEELREHDLPFAVVADPARNLYSIFGVETSVRSLAHPGAWGAMARGVFAFGPSIPGRGESVFGLPADFLIAPGGRVVASHYGAHADDQWSVEELLVRARNHVSTTKGFMS